MFHIAPALPARIRTSANGTVMLSLADFAGRQTRAGGSGISPVEVLVLASNPVVRRKISIRRLGGGGLRDALSDPANDVGLPAVVGAGRAAGDHRASTGEHTAGLAMSVAGGDPRPTSLPSATQTSTRPGCSGGDSVLVV